MEFEVVDVVRYCYVGLISEKSGVVYEVDEDVFEKALELKMRGDEDKAATLIENKGIVVLEKVYCFFEGV